VKIYTDNRWGEEREREEDTHRGMGRAVEIIQQRVGRGEKRRIHTCKKGWAAVQEIICTGSRRRDREM
jgi:hypothetical protein